MTAYPPGPRIGSLCSGYGGLDMAAGRVFPGARTVWVADPDPGAVRVLAVRFPRARNLGDITAADWTRVEPVEVLTAGYPCQGESNAGLRKGTADERWIWPHVADAVRLLRPRRVLLENVAAHLVRGFRYVIADLAALGYDTAWTCLRASDIGAPHHRDRLFVTAWPTTRPAGPVADPPSAGQQRPRLPRRAPGRGGTPTHPDRVGRDRGRPAGQPPQRHPEGTDRRAPNPARQRRDQRRPEPAGQHRGPDPALSGPHPHSGHGWGTYEPAIQRWETILGRPAPAATEPGRNGRRLSPRFVEWLMGLPTGHVTDIPGLSRNAQLRLLGNGVVPQQAATAYTDLLTTAETEEAA